MRGGDRLFYPKKASRRSEIKCSDNKDWREKIYDCKLGLQFTGFEISQHCRRGRNSRLIVRN